MEGVDRYEKWPFGQLLVQFGNIPLEYSGDRTVSPSRRCTPPLGYIVGQGTKYGSRHMSHSWSGLLGGSTRLA